MPVGGNVTMGTEAKPASNVSVYLNHNDCDHIAFQYRTSWWRDDDARTCLAKGTIKVEGYWMSHGVPRTAWSLVKADAETLTASTISVEECRGWEVGDRLVVRQVLDHSDAGVGAGGRVGAERTLVSVIHDGDGRACSLTLDKAVTIRGIHPATEERSV